MNNVGFISNRHAEGFHNKASRETGSNECLSDMALWDARLTPVNQTKGNTVCSLLTKDSSLCQMLSLMQALDFMV